MSEADCLHMVIFFFTTGSLSMATQWSDSCYFNEHFKVTGKLQFSLRAENTRLGNRLLCFKR